MAMRNITFPSLLWLLACLQGCTVLVEGAIDKKPADERVDGERDGGDGRDSGSAGEDGSMETDAGEPEPDGSTGTDPEAGPSDGSSPGLDAGVAGSKLCVGYNHACGIDAAGKIVCWGSNLEDQRTLPSNRSYVDLTCGDYHTCGIDSTGALVCAGRNRDGQRVTEAGPFVQVTAGEDQTCALDAAGNARCWGATARGQSTPPASETFSAISAGGGFTCGIRKSSGALVCWGEGAAMMMSQAAGKKLVSIDAGPDFVCGVSEAGDGACWGQNDYAVSALVDVQQISAGLYSGCALLTDGTVRCWYNGFSELLGAEDGGVAEAFTGIAVGGTGRCAVRAAGGVYCEPEEGSALVPGPDEFP